MEPLPPGRPPLDLIVAMEQIEIRRIGPPPISTASSDASASVAAGSSNALSSCAATSEAYRRPGANEAIAEDNSPASKLADTATGVVPATTLRISTCSPAT